MGLNTLTMTEIGAVTQQNRPGHHSRSCPAVLGEQLLLVFLECSGAISNAARDAYILALHGNTCLEAMPLLYAGRVAFP